MKRAICLVLLCICITPGLFAQTLTAAEYIEEGIKLHDKGDYNGAIDFYKKALLADSRSAHATYEMASSYHELKDYSNSIKYCDKVIAANNGYVDQAYILKGSAYDNLGQPQEAIKIYKKALQQYNSNFLLYYNLALTSFNLKNYTETENALQKSLKLNPSHASSHFLLALCMLVQEKKVQGILALYNYLLTEPKAKRTSAALQTLEEELAKKVKKAPGQTTTATVKTGDDEFYTAAILLEAMESAKKNESNKNKPAMQLFIENSNSLFTILGEMKKNKKGFWWNFYVDYFYTIATQGHTEALCYYIMQSKDNAYEEWIADKANLKKMEAFSDWYTKNLHKF